MREGYGLVEVAHGEPIEAGLPFANQEKKLKTSEQPGATRELVMYLVLVFLTTGKKLDFARPRTKDKAENGQRMTVWFSPSGFDLTSVSDAWKSPGIGLSAICTPAVSRKK